MTTIKKFAATIAGFVMILVGIALLVLPGPGIVTIIAGLVVLGTQYEWARRLTAPIKRKLEELHDKAEKKAQAQTQEKDR